MRDPRGTVSLAGDEVVRSLREPLPADDFLRLPAARSLVDDGLLVDFRLVDDQRVMAPRLEWVSQPSEWSRAQLLDAALLTLDVAERALEAGFELKDASAWNVIFDGCEPVFCDHLSFAKISSRHWHALGQFARHFILPQLVAVRRGLPVHAQFRMYRDGITLPLARALCGWGIWLSRAAPLALAAGRDKPRAAGNLPDANGAAQRPLHGNLLRFCRSALPARNRVGESGAGPARGWSVYRHERCHYSSDAVEHKAWQVREWLARAAPAWVLDLGANTGEFARIAAQCGARVIAVDADHDCIENLYLACRSDAATSRRVFPVVAQLDDLCAGRGWCGREAPGLMARLGERCDVVMMLALIHHLMIAGSVPVEEVAAFAAALTRDKLILETIPESDPMFQALAGQFARTDDAARLCGQAAQRGAFERHFEVLDSSAVPGSGRTLLLLSRKRQ